MPPADRVGQCFIGERKLVALREVADQRRRKPAGQRELGIDVGHAPAAGELHRAVEDDAPGLVLIEALIDEVLEKAPALRTAETDGVVDRVLVRLVRTVRHQRIGVAGVVAQKRTPTQPKARGIA